MDFDADPFPERKLLPVPFVNRYFDRFAQCGCQGAGTHSDRTYRRNPIGYDLTAFPYIDGKIEIIWSCSLYQDRLKTRIPANMIFG